MRDALSISNMFCLLLTFDYTSAAAVPRGQLWTLHRPGCSPCARKVPMFRTHVVLVPCLCDPPKCCSGEGGMAFIESSLPKESTLCCILHTPLLHELFGVDQALVFAGQVRARTALVGIYLSGRPWETASGSQACPCFSRDPLLTLVSMTLVWCSAGGTAKTRRGAPPQRDRLRARSGTNGCTNREVKTAQVSISVRDTLIKWIVVWIGPRVIASDFNSSMLHSS